MFKTVTMFIMVKLFNLENLVFVIIVVIGAIVDIMAIFVNKSMYGCWIKKYCKIENFTSL
jgi:hypothetical protein